MFQSMNLSLMRKTMEVISEFVTNLAKDTILQMLFGVRTSWAKNYGDAIRNLEVAKRQLKP